MEMIKLNGKTYERIKYDPLMDTAKCKVCDAYIDTCNDKCIPNYVLKEVKEEQLYICDSVKNCKAGYCMYVNTQPEPFESCNYNLDAKCIPYTEEKEPNTKRVAVIEFLDIPLMEEYRTEHIEMALYNENGTQITSKTVELIDLDRIRYGTVKEGDKYLGFNNFGEVKVYTMVEKEGTPFRLIIDPPTPESETVEQVLEELISDLDKHGFTHDIGGNKGFRDHYWSYLVRLKEAKERNK